MKTSWILAFFALNLTAPLSLSSDNAGTDCDYKNLVGKEFVFVEFDKKYNVSTYEAWFTEPNVYPGENIAYSEYVGKSGKLLPEPQNSGYSSDYVFRKAVIEDCRVVFGQDPVKGKRIRGIIFEKEYSDLKKSFAGFSKSHSGMHLWYKGGLPREKATPKSDGSVSTDPITPLTELQILPISPVPRFSPYGVDEPTLTLKVIGGTGILEIGFSDLGAFFTKNPVPKGTKKHIVDAIRDGQIVLGMSADQVVLSIGNPETINTTVGEWGRAEQWVYGNSYVYLQNGKVTGMQFSR